MLKIGHAIMSDQRGRKRDRKEEEVGFSLVQSPIKFLSKFLKCLDLKVYLTSLK